VIQILNSKYGENERMEATSGNQILKLKKKKLFCINVRGDLLNLINFIVESKTMSNHTPLIVTTEIKTQEYTRVKEGNNEMQEYKW